MFLILFVIICTVTYGQPLDQTVKDVNGNDYKTVKIGTQVWMAEDLNVSTFRNGDKIPQFESLSKKELEKYHNRKFIVPLCSSDSYNGKSFNIYNWYALIDPRGLAPEGWHIPTVAEWETLIMFLDNNQGQRLKSNLGWANYLDTRGYKKDYSTLNPFPMEALETSDLVKMGCKWVDGNGTNTSGFNAVPPNFKISQKVKTGDKREGDVLLFGSLSEYTDGRKRITYPRAYYFKLCSNSNNIEKDDFPKDLPRLSVRCIKD